MEETSAEPDPATTEVSEVSEVSEVTDTTDVEPVTEVAEIPEDAKVTEEATELKTEEASEAKTEEASEAKSEEASEAKTEEATEAKIEEATEAKAEEVSISTDKETEVDSVTTATEETGDDKANVSEATTEKPKEIEAKPKAKVKGKDAGYAYDAENYVVDEKNIFAAKKFNVFDENLNIFGKPRQSAFGPVISFSSSGGEEGEEYLGDRRSYLFDDLFKPTGDVSIPIDREAYLEEHRNLMNQKIALRQKNGILNKKMFEYYKKRKNERVFDEISPDIYHEVCLKYERKIDDLYEYRSKSERERESIENEITDMKQQRDDYRIELASIFHTMLIREKEVASGLIDTKTGKTISDKFVVTLIQRQTTKSTQIGIIRLAFIKKRDKVRDIEAMLKSMETIGGTLHLMDFEQIRMENQTFADKIEERDDELLRLRSRFSKAIQELAHVRLKSHVLEEKITHLEEKTERVEQKVTEAREYLTNLKLTRDGNRAQTTKLQLNSGLLTHLRLLRDFEFSLKQLSEIEQNYEEMKETNKDTRAKIVAIRQNIEDVEREQYLHKRFHPEQQAAILKQKLLK